MSNLLNRLEIESAPNPTAAVIWLHGLGADGNDFAAIVPELDLSGCPPIRFVFPHAPSIPVTINGGYVMPAWYDIRGANLVQGEDDAGIRQSAQAVEALIAHEVARGIPASRIVLAGFSQGCAMVLHTGLRHPAKLAGIMALSGYLPLARTLASERHAANQHTPIFMAHGIADPVVALARAEESRQALSQLGYALQWHTYPMPHSVHPQEIADMGVFLQSVLASQSA
ncbi:MAG: dienelactone hydrolase family protein [Gammaproteobacteria bacterium]|nr:dienelactone hydrolase family protein [Gammaproteobacteria bacterium]MBU0787676.1 dienelactone hydrolase family protein [Gammaproteobacteria bacterium]MBU0814854.1 dienelactone hydrolase family protein [Gammaproteobacteria bacterium]MBU1786038.1 dienelactone hydrolase family protein [Gammaproteobacteria bacterium]